MPRKVGKPRGLSSQEDVLSPQELKLMLLASSGDLKDSFIFRTLVFAGLRVSELKHLRHSWVNLEEQTITVPTRQYCDCAECKRKRDGIWRPKTKKGARTILIHPMLMPVIREFIDRYEEIGLSTFTLWRRVRKIAERAHISRSIYPHCLRATAATMLAYQKISAPALKYVMGWETLDAADAYVKSDMHLAHAEQRDIYEKDAI
jgi:integrase